MKHFLITWAKRLLLLVLSYAGLAAFMFVMQMTNAALRDPDADLTDDTHAAKMQRNTDYAEIVESVRKLVARYRTPEYQRDAHAKPHGCVRAEFEVFHMDSTYNYGLFSKPGRYEAWIRFSNGSVPIINDPSKDARGMAIKVMNVDGEQLLPEKLAGKTQDFVMISSPNFFVRTIAGYRELERKSAIGKPFTYFLGDHYINPLQWNLRELYLGLKTRTKAPNTPMSTQYYSASPYQLGPHEMKYSAKACENYNPNGIDRTDPNFLRNAMRALLKTQDACFQFMVQLRNPEARMPIQDTTVVWSEDKSPFVPVARVHIPKQEFDTAEQNQMCENLSFNVWHGTKELRPLSYFNELRRDLYLHTAAFRRVRNGAPVKEPNSWCDSLPSLCPKPAEEPATDPLIQL
mgnify:CR=1 FL=1